MKYSVPSPITIPPTRPATIAKYSPIEAPSACTRIRQRTSTRPPATKIPRRSAQSSPPKSAFSETRTKNVPTIDARMPAAATPSGNSSAPRSSRPVSWAKLAAAVASAIVPTIDPTYDSNRSAPMPATSPTLSPTLSAMTAGLRGSSSGMPCSTLPTRSAPTSAALVKIPPPTRAKSAIDEAPNEKPAIVLGSRKAR